MHQVSLANIPLIVTQTVTKKPGDKLHLTIQFSYQGPGNWSDQLYVNLYQYTDYVVNQVSAAGWAQKFDVSVTDASPDTPVAKQVTVDYVIQSGRTGGYGVMVYLVNNKDAGVVYLDVAAHTGAVIISAAVTPTLTLDITGTTITFTFTGMAKNATINVQVIEQVNQTTGAVTAETPVTSDANGAGTFKFTWTGATGTYWLKLTDASGNSVTQNFIVSVLPYLTVSPEIVKKGDTVAFAFAYFAKNAVITLRASSNTTSTVLVASVNSDAAGAGQYATTINLDPGVYVLDATDASGNKADAPFTVYETPIGLGITYPQYPKVAVGYGLQLGATATYADGTTESVGGKAAWVKWSSSDPSVATISSTGSVMGIKVGTTTITCIYTYPQATGYGTMTGTLTLTVVATQGEVSEPPVYAIDVTPHTPANLIQYYSQQFDAVLQYSQSSAIVYHDNLNVHWNSSNLSVATISSYGIVTGVAPGTTQISCIYGGTKSNVVTLTVIAPPSGAVTSVNGIVYDATEFTPLPGVTVTIGGVSVNTGSDGKWNMPNVSPGTPVKTFSATGYQSQTDKTFTILSGQANNMGVMALFAITNNLITLTLSNLPSGVVLGSSPNSFWSVTLYDSAGKSAAMVSITDATQKIYLPDDWVFPATFIFYMDKYIGTNEATEVANWQSYWGASSAHYTNYKFTGLGNVSLNVATGNYTAPVTPVASASISPVSAPKTTPRTVTYSGFHANDSLFYNVVEGNPSLSDGGRADSNGNGTFTIYPQLMYDSTGYNFLGPGTYTLHIQSGWQITANASFVVTN
jgi:hypothetical protein